MTPTTAPDPAAVEIAVDVVDRTHEGSPYIALDVCTALARADMLCPPGTLAEVERLRTALMNLVESFVDDEYTSPSTPSALREARAALDAAAAGIVERDRVAEIASWMRARLDDQDLRRQGDRLDDRIRAAAAGMTAEEDPSPYPPMSAEMIRWVTEPRPDGSPDDPAKLRAKLATLKADQAAGTTAEGGSAFFACVHCGDTVRARQLPASAVNICPTCGCPADGD